MNQNITVSQVAEKNLELKSDIKKLLVKFTTETGCNVNSIELDRACLLVNGKDDRPVIASTETYIVKTDIRLGD